MAIVMSRSNPVVQRLLSLGGRIGGERALRLVEFALGVTLAVQLAGLAWLIAPSAPPSGAERGAPAPGAAPRAPADAVTVYAGSPLAQLFGTPSAATPAVAELEPQRETPLDLKLKGVLAERDGEQQFALIAQGSSQEKVYAPGDVIAGAEILRIEPRRVILRRNGITESLTLEVELLQRVDGNDDRAADNPGRQRIVERATFEREIEDLPRLVRQAQAVPYSENGSPVGLRVVRIEQGSVFHDLGLEAEDVIRSVNGTPVRNVAEARAAYETFKNAGAYAIGVLRDGRELTLNYSIR